MALTRKNVVRLLAGIAVLNLALLGLRLGALERKNPAHGWIGDIRGGIPATLYLPEKFKDGDFPYQHEKGDRPPVVVIAHGYSADQAIMSPLARSLAEAGYAAVTFDFRGHGSNTAEFKGDLVDDIDAVVDWAQRSPSVDGTRIAVLGHSMGAGAVLDFATRDARPLAVVPFSGGFQLFDKVVPKNVLLIAAENDPKAIRDRQKDIAADLDGTKAHVESRIISGRDHVTVLYSNDAVKAIVGFLDPVMGVDRSGPAPGLHDPRLRTAALYTLLAVIVIGFLGLLTAKFVSPLASTSTAGGLLLVIGALVLTTPVMASGGINILPLGAGQPVMSQALLAGGLLWLLRLLVQRGEIGGRVRTWIGEGQWLPLRSVLLPGLFSALAIFVIFTPLAGLTHRLVPTPIRLILWIVVAAMVLPFFAAFEALVRRGGTWQAVGWGVLGRLILVVSLLVGLSTGTLPAVIGLVIPLLIFQYIVIEVFAATAYARGYNTAVIAVVESVFLAWITVTLTPIG